MFLHLTAEFHARSQSPFLEQKEQVSKFLGKQDISGQSPGGPSLDLMFFRGALLLLVIARDVLGDEDVDDFQSEHCAELLLGHASLDELALRHRSVVVLVHLVKR